MGTVFVLLPANLRQAGEDDPFVRVHAIGVSEQMQLQTSTRPTPAIVAIEKLTNRSGSVCLSWKCVSEPVCWIRRGPELIHSEQTESASRKQTSSMGQWLQTWLGMSATSLCLLPRWLIARCIHILS